MKSLQGDRISLRLPAEGNRSIVVCKLTLRDLSNLKQSERSERPGLCSTNVVDLACGSRRVQGKHHS